MLTPATRDVFARDHAAIERNPGYTARQRAVMHAAESQRHAEYEARWDAFFNAVAALDPRSQARACDLLAVLGKRGCLSGSYEYRAALDALDALGINGANRIFEHDRDALVRGFKLPLRAA